MDFKNTEVFNFEGAIRGARNPLESWARSDSACNLSCDECTRNDCSNCQTIDGGFGNSIGANDLGLMQRLIKAAVHDKSNSHSKFLRQIMVCVDIEAPLYWWKEFDTYKIGTTANSTSTMHKLASTPITMDCFEMDENDLNITSTLIDGNQTFRFGSTNELECIIDWLESLRRTYNETKDKDVWKLLIKMLPEAWLQTRTVTLNYQVVRQMYLDRKNHKLTEWSKDFINWVDTLPYAEELIKFTGEKSTNE